MHPARSIAAAAAVLLLTACSVSQPQTGDTDDPETVTLVAHDSWAVPDKLVRRFEEQSGYDLRVVTSGDAGELTNKLVLTAGDPLGDVAYGVDTTFATRAVEADVFAPSSAPAADADFLLTGAEDVLTPVDWSDVCVNVDDAWFAERDLAPPTTLADLIEPAYRDLFVTPAPSTSSPGFAFLLATIGTYGDRWQDYWRDLLANGARVAAGWEEAYQVDFTAGGGDGDRPVVLSYSSSPPFTIPEGGTRPTTSALLDTCFRQVEYAGVLRGAGNPAGARALVDFLVSRPFQEALPEAMYVLPTDPGARLPRLWARWAPPAAAPVEVDPAAITARRSEWIRAWSDLAAG